jgi:hypothetical protein
LLGSGETSPNIRKVYDELFHTLEAPVNVAILETPAGFEPNSDYVAGQVGAYLEKRLQNHQPQISIIPARKRDTAFSPDDPALLDPLYGADVIFMGPGSPTYAARQLRGSLAWQTLQACHRLGAALIFASATTIASSRYALPVYEIYKVGEDLHWQDGLDFFGPFGLNLVFVPHWNNRDGGDVLDTSHCYIGRTRYEELVALLPDADRADQTIVGIDENTALWIEPEHGRCHVRGAGGVRLMRNGEEARFGTGVDFPVAELGPFAIPAAADLPAQLWREAAERWNDARRQEAHDPTPDATILELLEQREAARLAREWPAADRLRAEIESAGWQIKDTPEGPILEPQ